MNAKKGTLVKQIWLIGFCVLLAGRVAPAQDSTPSGGDIELGRETTVLTRPLGPHGGPDYAQFLNDLFSRGVTDDTNAAVILVELFNPEQMFEPSVRARALAGLGHEQPPVGPFLSMPQVAPEQLIQAMQTPWTPQERPAIAEWLTANERLLDRLVEATRRPRLYFPLVQIEPGEMLLATPRVNLGVTRAGVVALTARAMLRAGQGRADAAGADLIALARLGTLMGQCMSYQGRLQGARNCGAATASLSVLATEEALSADQCLQLLQQMQQIRVPSMIMCTDTHARFETLDTIVHLGLDPNALVDMLALSSQRRSGQAAPPDLQAVWRQAAGQMMPGVDCNAIARRANDYYDQLVQLQRIDNFRAYRQASQEYVEQVNDMLDEARLAMQARNLDAPHSSGVNMRTRLVGSLVLASHFKPLLEGHNESLTSQTQADLTTVALALAAHKASTGRYPRRLAELEGAYLAEVPIDRYSGRPFIYSGSDTAYVLYSVGPNTYSDGGAIQEATGDDIVIQAPRPRPEIDDEIQIGPPPGWDANPDTEPAPPPGPGAGEAPSGPMWPQ